FLSLSLVCVGCPSHIARNAFVQEGTLRQVQIQFDERSFREKLSERFTLAVQALRDRFSKENAVVSRFSDTDIDIRLEIPERGRGPAADVDNKRLAKRVCHALVRLLLDGDPERPQEVVIVRPRIFIEIFRIQQEVDWFIAESESAMEAGHFSNEIDDALSV